MKLPWGFCSPLDFEHIGTNHVEIGGETKPESRFEDPGRFGRTPSARPNASRHWSEHGRARRRDPSWSDQRPAKLSVLTPNFGQNDTFTPWTQISYILVPKYLQK